MPLSWNLGTLIFWNPLGHPRPAIGLIVKYTFKFRNVPELTVCLEQTNVSAIMRSARLRHFSGFYSNIGQYFQSETNSQIFKIIHVTVQNRFIIEKLTAAHLVNKLPSFHLTLVFGSAFKKSPPITVTETSMYHTPNCFSKIFFNIIFSSTFRCFKWSYLLTIFG